MTYLRSTSQEQANGVIDQGMKKVDGDPTKDWHTVAYAWREPRRVLPLEKFEGLPNLQERAPFQPNQILVLSAPRMAGVEVKRTPEQLRVAIVNNEFDFDTRAYLRELWRGLDMFGMKLFRQHCSIALYELARAMNACEFHHWRNVDIVKELVPGYRSPLNWANNCEMPKFL